MSVLGDRIREQRNIMGISQQKLSDLLELSVDTVKSLETGRAKPSIETLTKLSDIFKCSTDYLLGKGTAGNNEPIESIVEELVKDMEIEFGVSATENLRKAIRNYVTTKLKEK